MNKPTITLTIGASASGKSTWATNECITRYDINEFNRDDVRFAVFTENERDWTKYKFTKVNEKRVTKIIDTYVEASLEEREAIIISDTNLNVKTRNKWKQWAKVNSYEYKEVLFPCDWKELVKRNSQREGGLSEAILWKQYKSYMQQFGKIGDHELITYEEDNTLCHTVICDLDGTVASMEGVRKPFEWDKVSQDNPRGGIIDMLIGRATRVGHITFLSGRDSICYQDTYDWINEYVIDSGVDISWELYMRPEGDWRKDDIIKYELFNDHIRGKYNVDCLFDDRRTVIRLWNLLGIPNVVDVGNYNEEF